MGFQIGGFKVIYAICILLLAFACYLSSFIANGESLKVRIAVGIAFGFLAVACAQVMASLTGGGL